MIIIRYSIQATLSNKFITSNIVALSRRLASTFPATHEKERTLNTETLLRDITKEKSIDITTCGLLFEKWRKERRYWKVPKSEIPFRVKYIDTGYQGVAANTPTVVSLHGSPGSYKDFDPLTVHLHQLGVRVIAPNFPGWEVELTSFRSTPEEKSEYVNDFLNALSVPRVDLLVCHSSAMFPGLLLSMGNRIYSPKSLVLLNPTTLDVPRLLHPTWLLHFLVRAREFPVGRSITSYIGKKLTSRPQLAKGTYEEHWQSATTLMNSYIPKQAVHFRSLLDQNYPVLMAFSQNDKLISQKSFHKMANMMVNSEEIEMYDKEGRKKNAGGTNPFRRVMAFENGTHFLLNTHAGIMCETIASFLFHHLNNRVNVK